MITEAGTTLTYRDIIALPEDGLRHELIEGAHYVSPSPVPRHQRIVGNLYYLLRRHLDVHEDGDVYLAPVDVVLSLYDMVVPDLILVGSTRRDLVRAKNVQGPPDLIVEVLSPNTSRRDRTLKRDLYRRAGVREYWVVDPKDESIVVHGGAAGEQRFSAACDRLISPLLPHLQLPVDEVFQG